MDSFAPAEREGRAVLDSIGVVDEVVLLVEVLVFEVAIDIDKEIQCISESTRSSMSFEKRKSTNM